jgi:hypothetical protein
MSGLDEQKKLFCPRCGGTKLKFTSPDGDCCFIVENDKFSIRYFGSETFADRIGIRLNRLLVYVTKVAWVWACVSKNGCGSINAHRPKTKKMWMKLRDAARKEYHEWT